MLTGENGILNRATTAKQTNEEKQAEEELKLGISALAIDYRKNTTNADSFRDYVMNNKQSLANAMGGATAGNSQNITGPETCPFCGTPLSSQTVLDRCPACDADIRSYYSVQ